jgi:hypothetical protein
MLRFLRFSVFQGFGGGSLYAFKPRSREGCHYGRRDNARFDTTTTTARYRSEADFRLYLSRVCYCEAEESAPPKVSPVDTIAGS